MLSFYLSLVADEDQEFFEFIYKNYKKQMHYTAFEVLNNNYDAEDAVHNVFLMIAQNYISNIKQFPNDSDVRNYLLTAVKNSAINILKRKNAKEICFEDEHLFKAMKDIPDEDFTELVHDKLESERIKNTIESLDEKYRNALYYHFVLGMTVEHVSDLLGQNYETTKKQIARGKQKLLLSLGYNFESDN